MLNFRAVKPALLAIAASLVTVLAIADASAQVTLRVVKHSDLKILDPIWTTAYITRDHGYMIYDTLFATDANDQIKPQMVDKYELSADKLTYTFTLRDGLLWHDGKPVTAEDCVASIKRWAAKDAMGQKMMSFVKDMPDGRRQRTFQIVLNSPTGLVLPALGKPSSAVPFMMPKRVADTIPTSRSTDYTGSGPFVFKKDEWKPGDKAVYVKFDKYKPRAEPPSGLAGGKVAKVDRVEWRVVADQQTAVNALIAGEIDFIEQPAHDLLPLLRSDRHQARRLEPAGQPVRVPLQYARQAVRQRQDAPGAALCIQPAGFPARRRSATSSTTRCARRCSSAARRWRRTKGMDGLLEVEFRQGAGAAEGSRVRRNTDRAAAVDRPAGSHQSRAGRQVVDGKGRLQGRHAVDGLANGGCRRAKKDPPAQGGWNAFLTSWVSADILNPVSTAFLNASCDKALFGWPCDRANGKIARRFRPRARPCQAKGDRRGRAGSLDAVSDAHSSRPVVSARRIAQECRGLRGRAGRRCSGTSARPATSGRPERAALRARRDARAEHSGHGPNVMLAYVARRLLATVPVMAVVAVLVFAMLRLTAGDPAAIIAGAAATSQDIVDIRQKLGLDRPIVSQFFIWLAHVLSGDFGESFFYKKQVAELIADRVGPTLALAMLTMAISIVVSLPLGVIAAYRQGTWVDRLIMGFSVLGFSVPVFVVGYVLIYVFSIELRWLPVQGYQPMSQGFGGFVERLILPSLALSVIYIALIARITRTSVLEVLGEDYIRTARAKGLTHRAC